MKTHLGKGLATLTLFVACAAAQADGSTFSAALSGAAENPPNASTATGNVSVLFDISNHYFSVAASFNGLQGASTDAHIHCCTALPGDGSAGIATMLPTLTGFPTGVTSGAYAAIFDTSQTSFWNPTFLSDHGGTTSGAESALLAALGAGTSYFNIHSDAYPGGEIRGFLAAPVPEPAQALLLLAGLPLLFLRRRKT